MNNIDSIYKSVFAFNYEDKVSASRCNHLIESIFNSQIHIALENAISSKIPEEITIQFESLEIDIGTINEKELPTELSKRIKIALNEALLDKIREKSLTAHDAIANTNFLLKLKALELYLGQGYFPMWMSSEISLEQLLVNLLDESSSDLIRMIKNYSSSDSAMKRLYTTKTMALSKLPGLSELRQNQTNKELHIKDTTRNSNIMEHQEIRIYNSGLIILWPFLTRFFEQLSLVKNGEFVNDVSSNRAVFLLQHLVYDKIDFPEYELVLNKLCVGLPLVDHLSPIAELTTGEKDLATSLMNGLISNWDKVKSSSIEGIQATFLQRGGILTIREESIALVIEKKGVDVLLSSLPWNISLIKLPWMEKPLHIEWI